MSLWRRVWLKFFPVVLFSVFWVAFCILHSAFNSGTKGPAGMYQVFWLSLRSKRIVSVLFFPSIVRIGQTFFSFLWFTSKVFSSQDYWTFFDKILCYVAGISGVWGAGWTLKADALSRPNRRFARGIEGRGIREVFSSFVYSVWWLMVINRRWNELGLP